MRIEYHERYFIDKPKKERPLWQVILLYDVITFAGKRETRIPQTATFEGTTQAMAEEHMAQWIERERATERQESVADRRVSLAR
jgi:hypothetical protein